MTNKFLINEMSVENPSQDPGSDFTFGVNGAQHAEYSAGVKAFYYPVPASSFKNGYTMSLQSNFRCITSFGGTTSGLFVYVYDGTNYTRFVVYHATDTKLYYMIQQVATRTAAIAAPGDATVKDSQQVNGLMTPTSWYGFVMEIDEDNNITAYHKDVLFNASELYDNPAWGWRKEDMTQFSQIGIQIAVGAIEEVGVGSYIKTSGGHVAFNIQLLTDYSAPPQGLDASIVFSSYYLRTALGSGGSGLLVCPSPFFSPISAATLIAQLKKAVTYHNSLSIKQFVGETKQIDLSTHTATYEVEEMIIKLQYVEVGSSPIVAAVQLRQWNGLVLEDKDGAFVSRGVTTSRLAIFEKADKKVSVGRASRDTFTITETDFTTPLVPDTVNNNKDEEMYYKDTWNDDDTDAAHIVLHTPGDNAPFVVKYPTDLFEKYDNLTKMNKLEIVTVMSAVNYLESWTRVGGDSNKYIWYLYNYQQSTWEEINKYGKNELAGGYTTSTLASPAAFYDEKYITVDVAESLKTDADDWLTATAYVSGDRAINNDTLFTCILNHTSGDTDDEPEVGATSDTYWQRTIYDFINYESTASGASEFSKLNLIPAIRTPVATDIGMNGFWMWDFSVKATFDDDTEPEYSSATISAVSATTITLNATSGINLPQEDGFGVDDNLYVVKNLEDYLQDAWDSSSLATDVGALTINITGASALGTLEDFTYKSFYDLMQHICELTNSSFWIDYGDTNVAYIVSADNHSSTGVVLTKADILGYDSGGWKLTIDASVQRNAIRILGDNVNYLSTLSPANDPFDLGDETEVINDSNIQTILQASTLASKIAPRKESSEVIATITLDFSNVPNQQAYYNLIKGETVALQLPDASDTSICNYSGGGDGELLIIAMDVNRNEQTGDKEHITLTLQRRYA
jgi:hypothetical protein